VKVVGGGILLAGIGLATACGSSPSSADAVNAATSAPATASASPASKVIRTQLGQGTITDPLKIDVAPPSQLTVQQVTIEPGGVAPWHTHPGAENSLVTAGQLTLTISTDPGCAPRHLGPGQAFDIPANTPHTARNDGTVAVTLAVTYLGNAPGATLVNPVPRPSGCSS
jgi:quercetin dioxygenase-like cupin family protein